MNPLDEHSHPQHGWKEIQTLRDLPKNKRLAILFLELLFESRAQFEALCIKMNQSMRESRDNRTRLFSPEEILIGLGLLIGACEFDQQGINCFKEGAHDDGESVNEEYCSLAPHPNFDRWMSFNRFKEFRRFFPTIWYQKDEEASDPWWKFSSAIETFNNIRKEKLVKGSWAIIDESMSAWRPRTTQFGGLPNLSHIPRKPEPLGTEFKSISDPITGCMLALEIQRGKEGMKDLRYNRDLGNTCGCTLRLTELTGCAGVKGDAWFGSVKSCANLKLKGYDSVLQIKQNHSLYPKSFVDEILGDAPGGVSIFLSGTLNGVKLIATGYRYHRYTFLYFVIGILIKRFVISLQFSILLKVFS